jgi:Protein tyrosine kinase.
VYDTKTYKKYIFKELNDSIYKNMLLFQKMAEEKDYLVDFKIITKNEKKYIITDFVNGLTFEDYFGQYNKNYIKRINQDELLNYIIKIAEINLDLMKSGWINRDIHQNNILITDNGIRMIDYDLIFKIDDNNGIVDSNGFRNNLYDIFRFFLP